MEEQSEYKTKIKIAKHRKSKPGSNELTSKDALAYGGIVFLICLCIIILFALGSFFWNIFNAINNG
jgi:hypothetical protein